MGSGGQTQRQTCSGRRPEHDCRWRRSAEPSALPAATARCTDHSALMSLVLARRIESKGALYLKWQTHKGTQRLRADFVDFDNRRSQQWLSKDCPDDRLAQVLAAFAELSEDDNDTDFRHALIHGAPPCSTDKCPTHSWPKIRRCCSGLTLLAIAFQSRRSVPVIGCERLAIFIWCWYLRRCVIRLIQTIWNAPRRLDARTDV